MEAMLLDRSILSLRAKLVPGADVVLGPDALAFVAGLARAFTPRVRELLARRRDRQLAWEGGRRPHFNPDTAHVRGAGWVCAPLAPELVDRRVEITGPPERRMVLHALNSGANVYIADFEDSLAPTFAALVAGQRTLMEAVRRTLRDESGARPLTLGTRTAALAVRPRGWHLWEKHALVDGHPVPAALFDAGLFLYHNARELMRRGFAPHLYLPKLQGQLEARLWNDVLLHAQRALGVPRGTVRATVLIETLPAAFEMDEILWELREHAAGLNFGRWDYIFSWVRVFAEQAHALLPDRDAVTMTQPFLRACVRRLVHVCHTRGVHAMGGMAAQVPSRDPQATEAAFEAVRVDKLREVRDGCDGTWVAHPALVPVARAVFDAHMRGPNQIHVERPFAPVTAAELLEVPTGPRTPDGLRRSLSVCLRYVAAWLGGTGCVALDGRMEDAATAEIARCSVWQQIRHAAPLDDGGVVTLDLVRGMLGDLVEEHGAGLSPDGAEMERLVDARGLLDRLLSAPKLPDFLTLPAYERILTLEPE